MTPVETRTEIHDEAFAAYINSVFERDGRWYIHLPEETYEAGEIPALIDALKRANDAIVEASLLPWPVRVEAEAAAILRRINDRINRAARGAQSETQYLAYEARLRSLIGTSTRPEPVARFVSHLDAFKERMNAARLNLYRTRLAEAEVWGLPALSVDTSTGGKV